MRRSFLLAFALMAPCAGCASMATSGGGSARSLSSYGTPGASSLRRMFVSELRSREEAPAVVPSATRSQAWGSVRIIMRDDDSFEYLMTIYNPRAEAFTAAHVRSAGTGGLVATLFSDVTLRTQYIQLRGTVSLARGTRPSLLAEELQERPRAFAVEVRSTQDDGGPSLVGVLQ